MDQYPSVTVGLLGFPVLVMLIFPTAVILVQVIQARHYLRVPFIWVVTLHDGFSDRLDETGRHVVGSDTTVAHPFVDNLFQQLAKPLLMTGGGSLRAPL